MANVKNKLKGIGRQFWELFKGGITGALMYACAGAILAILTLKTNEIRWDGGKIAWTVVCIFLATAYAGFMAYAHGSAAYDMLVTGNLKRISVAGATEGYKMSGHIYAKEYRAWKGFGMAAFMTVIPLVCGIIFGAKQDTVDYTLARIVAGEDEGLGVGMFIALLIAGWSLLPFFISNAQTVAAGGVGISYYYSCFFALLPLLVAGGMYIVGAYAKRAKTLRQQQIADRAEREAKENREKKINYGGLPGTKPKKRK